MKCLVLSMFGAMALLAAGNLVACDSGSSENPVAPSYPSGDVVSSSSNAAALSSSSITFGYVYSSSYKPFYPPSSSSTAVSSSSFKKVACYGATGGMATCTETTPSYTFARDYAAECLKVNENHVPGSAYMEVKSACPSDMTRACEHKGLVLYVKNPPLSISRTCDGWISAF